MNVLRKLNRRTRPQQRRPQTLWSGAATVRLRCTANHDGPQQRLPRPSHDNAVVAGLLASGSVRPPAFPTEVSGIRAALAGYSCGDSFDWRSHRAAGEFPRGPRGHHNGGDSTSAPLGALV